MGCCFSRTSDGPDNQPAQTTTTATRPSQRPGDLASHPNAPLQPLPRDLRVSLPDSNRYPTQPGPWTRKRLAKERLQWWATRTEGQADIWNMYRECVKLAFEGDLENAQALLDATGCTCPTGELSRRIYGPDGVEYSINGNKWLVFEPVGLVSDEAAEEWERSGGRNIPIVSMSGEDSGKTLTVKCRISDTGKDHIVELPYNAVVSELITELRKRVEHYDKKLSVAFMGKRYDSDTVIHSFYQEGQVLIIMVLPLPDARPDAKPPKKGKAPKQPKLQSSSPR